MNNQVEFRDGANIFGNPVLENDFVFGKANAYGVEVYLEKKQGRTTGWLGYTLSRTTRVFADINEEGLLNPGTTEGMTSPLSLCISSIINLRLAVTGFLVRALISPFPLDGSYSRTRLATGPEGLPLSTEKEAITSSHPCTGLT